MQTMTIKDKFETEKKTKKGHKRQFRQEKEHPQKRRF